MALALTSLTTTIDTGNTTTITTASISPTGDALLCVFAGFNDSAANNFASCSDSLTGTGSWTQSVVAFYDDYSGNNDAGICIYTAKAGSSPGSGTITVTHDNATARKLLHVVEITGYNTGSPTGTSGSATQSGSTTLNVAAGVTPASDSLMLAGIFSLQPQGNNLTVDGAYTENAETETTGGANIKMLSAYDNGGVDSDVDFSNINTSGDDAVGGVILEIKIASAGATTYPDVRPFGIQKGLYKRVTV